MNGAGARVFRRNAPRLAALLLCWQAVLSPALCRAQPRTIFQWSSGPPPESGPALDEPMETDRPDFTEASSTVGLHVVQLEGGYTYTFDNSPAGSFKSHSLPETLLRVGVFNWMELRIDDNYLNETTTQFGVGRMRASGLEDLTLGTKIGLTLQQGVLPELGVILRSSVPTGSGGFSAGEMLPGFTWAYGWKVSETLSIGGASAMDRALDDFTNDTYLQLSQSFTTDLDLTDELSGFAEWYVIAPSGADTVPTQHNLDGGFKYLVTKNLQLDIRVGMGLSQGADDFFTGAGASARW